MPAGSGRYKNTDAAKHRFGYGLSNIAPFNLETAVESVWVRELSSETAWCGVLAFHLSGERRVARIPDHRSREGGNPFLLLEQVLRWTPAFAGATLRLDSPRCEKASAAVSGGKNGEPVGCCWLMQQKGKRPRGAACQIFPSQERGSALH